MSQLLIGFFLGIIATFFFALNNIVIARGLKTEKLFEGIFVTLIFSSLIIFVFSLLTGEFFQIFTLSPIAWLLFIATGLINFVLARTFNYTGIALIGPSRNSAIVSTQILFAAVFGFVFLAEKLDLYTGIGVILAFIGIFIVSMSQKKQNKEFNFRGILYALFTAFLVGIAIIIIKEADNVSNLPIDGALISYCTAVLVYAPVASIKEIKSTNKFTKNIFFLLATAGILSGLAQIARYTSLKDAPVVLIASIIATAPLATMIVSFFVNKKNEILSKELATGSVITVIGVILIILSLGSIL